MIFVDSSAFLAIMAADDLHHRRAKLCLLSIREQDQKLLTNNYVLVESLALIQNRLGLKKVRDFLTNILPLAGIEWVDEEQHETAVQNVISADRRQLSLVDCSAFETMRRRGIDAVFTFDEHFREQGFKVIP